MVDLALSLKEGKLGTDPLTASGRVGLAGDTLSLRDLTVGYVAHRLAAGEGSLDLGAGSFALTGLYTGEYFMDTVRFAAGLSGTFPAGRAQVMGSHPFEQDIKGTLALSRITVNTAAMPGLGGADQDRERRAAPRWGAGRLRARHAQPRHVLPFRDHPPAAFHGRGGRADHG